MGESRGAACIAGETLTKAPELRVFRARNRAGFCAGVLCCWESRCSAHRCLLLPWSGRLRLRIFVAAVGADNEERTGQRRHG